MRTHIYYIPEAQENDRYVFDGVFLYEGLSSLTGLNGKGRFKKFFRKIGKGIKKIGKFTFKVVKKAIPVASAVATFIPGVGWAVKAGLTVADIAVKKIKKRRGNKIKKLKKRPSKKLRPISNQSRRNRIKVYNHQIYKKKSFGKRKTHKKIHVSPELLHEQALQAANEYMNYLIQLVDLKTKDKVTASMLQNLTNEQLSKEKRNIFNDVSHLLFNY